MITPDRPSDHLGEALRSLVSGLVAKDPSIKNCVLAVTQGDGAFAWSGAAGMAYGHTPMTTDTPIYIASITKLYTATVVMRLYEQGALALDDPMAHYLPHGLIRGLHVYRGKDYTDEVTITHLLSHSSGIADYYSDKGQDGKSLFDLFLEHPDRSWTVEETIERARSDLPPHFPPGRGTAYSDTNFQLVGKIIETVTGKRLHDVYEEVIVHPLALRQTFLVGHRAAHLPPTAVPADVFLRDTNITTIRANGSYWADGGMVATAGDMLTFLRALKEGRLVGRDTLRRMHHWRRLYFLLDYGFGTMQYKLPWGLRRVTRVPPLWGHSGSIGSFLYYGADLDLSLAGTVNQAASQTTPFFLMYKAIRAMQRIPERS